MRGNKELHVLSWLASGDTLAARRMRIGFSHRFPDLWRIRDQIEKLARTLIPHMINEERFLFPNVSTFQTGDRAKSHNSLSLH